MLPVFLCAMMLIFPSVQAFADGTKVEVSATVENAGDITDGMVTGVTPVQVDYSGNEMIASY